jgi:peptide/nickel transport system substrate-binding protein
MSIRGIHTHAPGRRLFCRLGASACLLLFSPFRLAAALRGGKADAAGDPASPARGDRIIFGGIAEASNLIGCLATDSASHEICSQIFVSPLRYDKNLRLEPYAAASYEVLEDGRLLRFTLLPGILWEDGVELTAEDVEFTYRVVIDPATASPYAEDFRAVREFLRTGRYSFEARYAGYYARALASWTSDILPRHILEGQNLRTSPFARAPVGAGPFKLAGWKAGSEIRLAASPTHFKGRPRLDEAVFRVIPDPATMFLEAKAGKVDMMGLSPQQYLRQTVGPAWDAAWRKYRYLASGYVYLGFNLKHPFFADARVRKAVSLAVDRESIIKGVLLGQGIAAFGPYKPGTWPYHPHLKPYARDVELSRRLLAEAGFVPGRNGIMEKGGHEFSFTILTNQGNDQRIKSATIIQSQLRDVGIRVRIRTVEWAAFIKEFVDKGRFDAIILGWTIPMDPDGYAVWHSDNARPGGLNFIGYRNPEVDALLVEARSTPDQERRGALYARFQEILHEEQPYAFLFVPYALPMVQARFRGVEAALGGIMHNLPEWWVAAAEQRYHP